MISKRIIHVLTFALLAAMLSMPAFANPRFYNVQVIQIGVAGNRGFIRLTDVGASAAFTKKWFRLNDINRNEMLALAMGAVTSNITLKVKADLDDPGKPLIRVMYLQDSGFL